jgi:hypothetical protein
MTNFLIGLLGLIGLTLSTNDNIIEEGTGTGN